jgi:hypothetical protein
MWESNICYENRLEAFTTSRWRLAGLRTRAGGENTDGGLLWLQTARAGDTATAELYKDRGLASADKVAEGSADVSDLDAGGEPVELTLSEANGSGLSGSLMLHEHLADDVCPLQVALCVDADLDTLWDGIEALPGYDATAGCAEFIRLASEDVLARVSAVFRDRLGGRAARAWFLADGARELPDLRRIANPAQLRLACAHRALEIALGRSHRTGGESMYSRLRDYHRGEFDRAMASLVLSVTGGGDGPATAASGGAVRQQRA